MPRLRPALFAYTRVTNFGPTELKVDLQVMDEAGSCSSRCRASPSDRPDTARRGLHSTLYEYQWKLKPRVRRPRAGRDSHHLPSPEALHPVVQEEGEALRQRFDRARYQNEFQCSVAGDRCRLHRARVA